MATMQQIEAIAIQFVGQQGYIAREPALYGALGQLDLSNRNDLGQTAVAQVADYRRQCQAFDAALAQLAGVVVRTPQAAQAAPGTIGTPEQFAADLDAQDDQLEYDEAVRAGLSTRCGATAADALRDGRIALADARQHWENVLLVLRLAAPPTH